MTFSSSSLTYLREGSSLLARLLKYVIKLDYYLHKCKEADFVSGNIFALLKLLKQPSPLTSPLTYLTLIHLHALLTISMLDILGKHNYQIFSDSRSA